MEAVRSLPLSAFDEFQEPMRLGPPMTALTTRADGRRDPVEGTPRCGGDSRGSGRVLDFGGLASVGGYLGVCPACRSAASASAARMETSSAAGIRSVIRSMASLAQTGTTDTSP
jgi:hypothetical protein